jgi:hypothetical protein
MVELSSIQQKVDISQFELRAENRLVASFSSILLFGKLRRPYRSIISFVSIIEDGY